MASIHLISVGSRGDLDPYLTLLNELKARGHDVQLIGSINFQTTAIAHGLRFSALPGDFRDLMGSEQGLQLMEGQAIRLVNNDLLADWMKTAREAIQGCDLLLAPPLAIWSYHLAEAEGCRFAVTSPIPLVATRQFPFLQWPGKSASQQRSLGERLRGRLNRFSYNAIRLIKWRQERDVIQAFRAREGLPKLPWNGTAGRRQTPPALKSPAVLHLFSQHVVSRPDDWPPEAQVTGYCLPADVPNPPQSASPALLAFLRDGPAPVYAGFGSMIPRDPHHLAEVVIQAAQDTGHRLILSPGWGHVLPRGDYPASVFMLEACPHRWLFPQLHAAIHHGGAGTTATALLSGIPSIVVSFFADQPAWGDTLVRLGVSPASHRASTVTAEALSRSLACLKASPRYHQRARELQTLILGEQGASRTADAVEQLLPQTNEEAKTG